jgi:hypothetical protein
MSISWASNVTYPVNLYGVIPHGTAFSLPISQTSGTDSYDWTVDIASGTDFVLLMSDAGPYQTGGSTGLLTVGSGNTNCMDSSSPASVTTSASSTSASATSSSTSAASASASVAGVGGSSSGGTSESGPSSSNHTGAIAGGAVGGVAFLVLLALLLFCCIRRRARTKGEKSDPAIKSYGVASGSEKRASRRPMDLLAGRGRVASDEEVGGGRGDGVTENYQPSPFRYPSPPSTPAGPGVVGALGGAATGAALGGAAMAGRSEKANQPSSPIVSAPFAAVAQRHSEDSQHSRHTQTNTNTYGSSTPPTQSATPPQQVPPPPSTQSEMAATDVATAGHGVRRGDSIRKTPSMQQLAVPSSPGLGGGIAENQGPGGRRLPDVPGRSDATRFVQHEDSGQVV